MLEEERWKWGAVVRKDSAKFWKMTWLVQERDDNLSNFLHSLLWTEYISDFTYFFGLFRTLKTPGTNYLLFNMCEMRENINSSRIGIFGACTEHAVSRPGHNWHSVLTWACASIVCVCPRCGVRHQWVRGTWRIGLSEPRTTSQR